MSAKILTLILAMCLIFTIMVSAQEVVQEFSLSKKLTGENTRFDLAVNPTTGDALIVWERLHYNDDGKYVVDGIYYALAKKKPSCKYRIIGPKYLYKSGRVELTKGYEVNEGYQFPDVEYNPYNNTFMVVMSSSALSITKAQVVSANGKLKGEAVWVWPDTGTLLNSWKDMMNPRISYIPGSDGQFRIFFRHDHEKGTGYSDDAGIFTGIIDAEGKFISENPVGPVFKNLIGEKTANSIKAVAHEIGGIEYAKDGKMLIGYSRPIWDDSDRGYTYVSYVGRINADGEVLASTKVGEVNSAAALNITPLSKRLYMFTFQGDWTKEACQGNNQLNTFFTLKLKKRNKTTMAIPDENCSSAWAVKLGKDRGSYQVFKPSREGAIYGRYITPRGKYGAAAKLIDTESFYGFVQAVAIPGTDDVFVAWMKSSDQDALSENEIRGFLIKAPS